MTDRPSITLEDAIKAGYRCMKPDCMPKLLMELCNDLGPGYHLASMSQIPGGARDCVIHRVIGSGYDIEIYGPLPRSREGRYAVVLWEAYGTHVIGEIKDVPFSNVGDRVMELVATWCPPEVCKALWGNSDSV